MPENNSHVSHVDLYSILKLDETATKKDITKRYRELSKKYHPDKGGDEKIFELITKAYNVLADSKLREEYDKKCEKLVEERKERSFVGLKEKFKDIMDKLDQECPRDPEEIKAEFEKYNSEFDKKHKFNRDDVKLNCEGMQTEELLKRARELELARQQDDIEIDDPIFADGKFDPDKFHAVFDAVKSKRDQIITVDEPEAWNAIGNSAFMGSAFTQSTYNDIYAEDDDFVGNNTFSSIDKAGVKIDKSSINIADITGINYYKNHNNIDVDYEKLLQERLKERKNFDRVLKKQ